MPGRQSVGRRFIDIIPDAPMPPYPVELERRRVARREGDRAPFDPRRPRRRAPLLFRAEWNCAHCNAELRRELNIAANTRHLLLAEGPLPRPCECPLAAQTGQSVLLRWKFQSGTE